jgi:hypothetical protein
MNYVHEQKLAAGETFVPLVHPPGHAQVDFGEAIGTIDGVRQKMHVSYMDLPHSDAPFMKAYPAETTEAFLDGHVSTFAFFGGARSRSSTTTPYWRLPRSAEMARVSAREPLPDCSSAAS